jgi:hypothetical protein
VVARRGQGPLEEIDRVVEAEHVVIILNIVLSQELINLFSLYPVVDVNIGPIVASG